MKPATFECQDCDFSGGFGQEAATEFALLIHNHVETKRHCVILVDVHGKKWTLNPSRPMEKRTLQ